MTLVQEVIPAARAERDAASFRDPSGFVFHLHGHVYRAVDRRVLTVLRELIAKGVLHALMADGKLIGTRILDEDEIAPELRRNAPRCDGFLQHARIPRISYPYEWSPAMLADAGLLTLQLQERLLAHGFALKDATAYNVQFINSRPVFIDIPSIERPVRPDVWHALGQFNRMFTQPLLLHRRRGNSLRGYFLASLDGAPPEEVTRAFGWMERLLPSLLLDVTLPAWLARRGDQSQAPPPSDRPRTRGTAGQLWNLRRLRARLTHAAQPPAAPMSAQDNGWSAYTRECNYSPAATDAKLAAVRTFIEETRPSTVLDAGCNTGTYSLMAAEMGCRVVAIDSDVRCVDRLYHAARAAQAAVLPLCIDLANPSPAIGFRNRERSAFLARARCDCVLALALMHHLHVSANLPLTAIRDLFADLAERDLVLEFVPPSDEMFQRLTRYRNESYADLTLDRCIRAFEDKFVLRRHVKLPDTARSLLFFRRWPDD